MCGIGGVAGPAARVSDVDLMLDAMVHRGPDGSGLWHGQDIVLGHRRLAIVDLSERGRQPMQLADAGLYATTNGEIYNYPELRAELEAEGATFFSDCDSEVILHGYRAWGTDSFARYSGMFAFALWDDRRKTLFVVRDRLGIKPIYYRCDGRTLSFASDIKAILRASGQRSWAIDPRALGQYLAYQNIFGDLTMFSGISAVRPGHYLEFRDGRAEQHSYWSPEFGAASDDSFAEATAAVRTTLDGAVTRHLMGDVPVATYLSAGIDSTSVAAVAARLVQEPLLSFTGQFEQSGWYDEAAGARLVADRIGSVQTEVPIGPSEFSAHFDAVIHALDEPRMGMGAFSQYMVALAAAKTRKVILTGHGGDELLSGYPVFKFVLFSRLLWRDPLEALRLLASVRPGELPHWVYFALRTLSRDASGGLMPMLFSPSLRRQALQQDVAARVDQFEGYPELAAIQKAAKGRYQRLWLSYLQAYLPGLLVVEDKISMAHALEARTPLLDDAMVDLSLRIDEQTKLTGGQGKALLRAAMHDRLPTGIFAMPKRGFPTPLRSWLRGELKPWMDERLIGPQSALTRLFKREYLEKTVRGFHTSWRRRFRPLDEIQTHRVWMLLSLESWLRQHEEQLGIRLELDPGKFKS